MAAEVRASCHVKGCRGKAGKGHVSTATHQAAVRSLGNALETNGPIVRMMPATLRDPYGDRRDWDAEERAANERALLDLIESGPLPEAPTTEYPDGMALITLREAGRRLGVKPDTLLKAIHRGRMTGHKYGRDWLVEESEVRYYELVSLGRVGWPKGRPRKVA